MLKLKFGFFDLFQGAGIDKKVLNWIFAIFFGLFGIGLLTLIYQENKAGDCSPSKQAFYAFEYQGKIIRTYRSNNHGHWVTVFENGMEKESMFDYKIWSNLKPGDVFIKHKNELDFTLIRNGDTTNYKEDIPDCSQFKEE